MCVKSVGHEFELSIRRHKRDGAIVLEPRQTHTLVELHVFQIHGLALSPFNKQTDIPRYIYNFILSFYLIIV